MARRRLAALLAGLALVVGACAPNPSPSPSAAAVASPSAVPTAPPVSPPPTSSPTATPVATMAPPPPELSTVEPVKGTRLPLAARNGAPGLVACNRIPPNTMEAILAVPPGAETREGDEYDVLRTTIAQHGDDSEFNFTGDTFREFRIDDSRVEFLGTKVPMDGRFSSISAEKRDGLWSWAGMDGGCVMQGQPGPDWGWVNWRLDPAFAEPTATTRTLHLLATDYECVGDAKLRGRLSPAWVFLEANRVRVQVFSTLVDPDAECTDQKPTKVTVRLPEPLGTRELVDANPGPCRGCGG